PLCPPPPPPPPLLPYPTLFRPTVVPNGPCAAASGSTWIHWWSPVASANWSMLRCSIVNHELVPSSRSPACSSSSIVSCVAIPARSEGHKSELQSRGVLV